MCKLVQQYLTTPESWPLAGTTKALTDLGSTPKRRPFDVAISDDCPEPCCMCALFGGGQGTSSLPSHAWGVSDGYGR